MPGSVNFGLWYDFRNPEPWRVSFERLYDETLEQIAWAEDLGIDSVWLSEHHFADDGYAPSPLVIASAIASSTAWLRIGTNLMVLPLHDPVRVAEDAATVSLISGGRFDLGVAIGYRESEFKAFGRSIKNRPSLIEEGVDIIRRAWAGESIEYQGKRHSYPDVRVAPAPEHTPRLLIGGMAEPAIDRAARIGDGFLSTGGIGHDEYVAGLAKAGRAPDDGKIFAGCWGIVTDDPERELAMIGEHILYQANAYVAWGAFGPPEEVPPFPTAAAAVENGLYEFWTPDVAVERLTAMIASHPQIADVHLWAQFPGEAISSGARRVELLAGKVLPAVRARLAGKDSA